MCKKILLALLFSTVFQKAGAQGPVLSWSNSFGGSSADVTGVADQLTDGGFIMAGATDSVNGVIPEVLGGGDVLVVRTDNVGNLVWAKTFGGSASDVGRDVRATPDGGCIIAAQTGSSDNDVAINHGSSDVWLVKLDALGAIEWEKTYGGTAMDDVLNVIPTNDGGYILAIYSASSNGDFDVLSGNFDTWIVKVDAAGAIEWKRNLGIDISDRPGFGNDCIQQTSDGGFVVCAIKWGMGTDAILTKLDAAGNITWSGNFGGSGDDHFAAVRQTTDGGYLIGGFTNSIDGDVADNPPGTQYNFWVIHTDSDGQELWHKFYGGSDGETLTSMLLSNDGSFYLLGFTRSTELPGYKGGEYDTLLLKAEANGDPVWQKCYGGSHADEMRSLRWTSDGGLVIGGQSYSSDGDLSANLGERDFWIAGISAESLANIDVSPAPEIKLYPNPVRDIIRITMADFSDVEAIEINDIGGRTVARYDGFRDSINVSGWPSGLYLLRIQTSRGDHVERFLKK